MLAFTVAGGISTESFEFGTVGFFVVSFFVVGVVVEAVVVVVFCSGVDVLAAAVDDVSNVVGISVT